MKNLLLGFLIIISSQLFHNENDIIKRPIKTNQDINVLNKTAAVHIYLTNWNNDNRDTLKQYLEIILTPICKKYENDYSLPLNELVAVISTMATSESGNSKGQPFSSFLFQQHNNPFGIKGIGSGQTATIEYYDGVRTEINDSFKHFESLKYAVDYLLGTFLMTNRYENLRNARNYKEFFTQLRKCGYFTHPTWDTYYLIPTCEKYYL